MLCAEILHCFNDLLNRSVVDMLLHDVQEEGSKTRTVQEDDRAVRRRLDVLQHALEVQAHGLGVKIPASSSEMSGPA